MRMKTVILVSLLLIAFFLGTVSAQEVAPAAKKISMKSFSLPGWKGAKLKGAKFVFGNPLYLFVATERQESAPRETDVNFLGVYYKGNLIRVEHGIPQGIIYSIGAYTDFSEHPVVDGVTIVATVEAVTDETRKLHLASTHLGMETLNQPGTVSFSDTRAIYEAPASSKKFILQTSLAGRSIDGRAEMQVAINFMDQSKSPYKYSTMAYAFGVDPLAGISKSMLIIKTPGAGKNAFMHFSAPAINVVTAYKENYSAPMMGSSYPNQSGGSVMLARNNPSFKYNSVQPAANKLRLKDVVKSTEIFVNYPVRQPRLITWHDNSLGLIYQSLVVAAVGSTIGSYDINYHYAPVSGTAKLSRKPEKLAFPAWKRILKETKNTYNLRHESIPSYYIPLGDGKFCLMELLTFERLPYNVNANKVSRAKAKNTEIQGRVLTFDSKTKAYKQVKLLKLKYGDGDWADRCWAIDIGDELELLVTIYRASSRKFETLKGSIKKSDLK